MMENLVSSEKVKSLVDKYGGSSEAVIQVMQDIQNEYRYLPKEALLYLAEHTGVPLAQVYHVATFYTAFSLTPKGRHIVTVCMGTACHVRSSPKVLDQTERVLNIKAGETSADMEFSLETVNCIGCCALGPVVVIDGEYHGKLSPHETEKLIKQFVNSVGGQRCSRD